MFADQYRVHPADEPPSGFRGRRPAADPPAVEGEDLAYKVELWDKDGQVLEQVLAVTSSASIGYAAFYAATREFPEAVLTLRHKKSVLSRWGGQPH